MIGRTNVGGGAAGGTLTVKAPAGVTISASKDGKVKTKTANVEGVATFKGLETGTWTLTITEGTESATTTVEIVADYSVEMDFTYFLFNDSNQFESRTGGWSKSGYSISDDFNSTNNSQVTIGDSIVCKAVIVDDARGTDKGGACGTVNKVDVSGYTKLRVKGSVSGYRSEVKLYIGVSTTKALTNSPTAKIALTANGDFEKTLTLPTSATSYYIFVLAAVYTSVVLANTTTLTVDSISLE